MDDDTLAAARCLIDYARDQIAPDGVPDPELEPDSYPADVLDAAALLEAYLDTG